MRRPWALCLACYISDDILDQPRINSATNANRRDHHIIRLRFAELNIPSDFNRLFSKISKKISKNSVLQVHYQNVIAWEINFCHVLSGLIIYKKWVSPDTFLINPIFFLHHLYSYSKQFMQIFASDVWLLYACGSRICLKRLYRLPA